MVRTLTFVMLAVVIAFGVTRQLQGPPSQAADAAWPYSQFAGLDRDKPVLVELSAAW